MQPYERIPLEFQEDFDMPRWKVENNMPIRKWSWQEYAALTGIVALLVSAIWLVSKVIELW